MHNLLDAKSQLLGVIPHIESESIDIDKGEEKVLIDVSISNDNRYDFDACYKYQKAS